jgi:uncharacterized protein YndB with AHSA1/START domain
MSVREQDIRAVADEEELSYHRTFVVRGTVERVFDEFVNARGGWWPYDHSRDVLLRVGYDPRVDGDWFDVLPDGARRKRGKVLAWDPPHRLIVSWPLTFGKPAGEAVGYSRLEVTFTRHTEGEVRVGLHHWDMHNTTDRTAVLKMFSPYGWDHVVNGFTAYLASAPWR